MAFFAIGKNLVTFLTGELHETNVDAARNVSTWIGSCFLTPVIGAFLADTYWGRYKTIVIFLLLYTTGMLILTVSAFLPLIMDLPNNSGIRRIAVYLGLYLVALGTGGIKPCTSALGADQFDGADPVERATKGSFFNWYYFAINIGSLLSGTVLVWVQQDIGWGVGFAVPMVLMVFGLAVFVAGRKVYRFFDKAAIVVPWTGEKGTAAPTSPWRRCTASQVEELKMLLRMLPVWASMVLFFATTAQMSSTFIEQGAVMDNRVGHFTVPPASLATFDVISVMVCIPVYDAVLVPLARRATGKDRGLSQLQRIGVGLALSVVGMAYAALIEARRLALARTNMPAMNIMWQAPAFAILGAGEVFASIGILEFFYDNSPDGMKSLGNAFAQLAIAAGSYLNSAVLGAVAATTARGVDPGWIPDDLNKGHLDYFFWIMAALSLMNLAQFAHCSMRYRGKTIC
ncbi:Protein NRT1/ PTR FAMILY 8.5 [Dichanthelium oligosanthes]|uniref:Protein NRT1/ PTR FAMILY 8.5 n=1 Tax=Dichanthelium oligosanthes TaxID=888268 RepID=A0A1E5UWH9_9POAL|nr:Protein NRT1/ PTR FAMILY 8.5 [Dichanthelium oligosanthes]